MKKTSPAFLLKADLMPLTVLKLNSANIDQLQQTWQETIASAPQYFTHAPIVIDASNLNTEDRLDVVALCAALKASHIIPVGIKGLSSAQHEHAKEAGLAILKNEKPPRVAPIKESEPAQAPIASDARTQIITKPIRSGSQVYAKNCDLLIMASVNPGAEVIADGNIHIYGPLRGRALAGASGNTQAHIFCQQLEAELVSIAGHYLVKEKITVPKTKKPMLHVFLNNQQLNIEGI